MTKTRIAILNSHPIQYFAPLYAYLNKDPCIEVTALYLSDFSLRGAKDPGFGQSVTWNIDLLAGYPSVFIGKNAKVRVPGRFFSIVAPEIWSEIRSGRYDVIALHGHNYAANLIAIAAAKSIGLPVFMRGETHLGLVRRGLKSALRRPVMGLFYRICDCCLAIGSANAAFYRAMGVSEKKIFLVPYTVDNTRFMLEARMDEAQRATWRTHFAIPSHGPAILYAAKFAPRKRPDDFLAAVVRVHQSSRQPFTVVMCGSGEMELELRAYCQAHALNNVVFTGFINQAELPKLYGACDVFVLPSENEPWGLAVNEAMCAALPIVVSKEVGCVADLVSNGVNGFTPNARDIDGLTIALRQLIESESLRKSQGAESLKRISCWSYRECLEGLHAAISYLQAREAARTRHMA